MVYNVRNVGSGLHLALWQWEIHSTSLHSGILHVREEVRKKSFMRFAPTLNV